MLRVLEIMSGASVNESSVEDVAPEVVGEYLAAFLAVEQDWGVIDGLMHARTPQEALEHYVAALRSIHKVLEEKGGLIYYNISEILGSKQFALGSIIDKYSKFIQSKLLDKESSRTTALKLVERTLAKYPKYRESKER
jgi:hypothetical protein